MQSGNEPGAGAGDDDEQEDTVALGFIIAHLNTIDSVK